MKKGLIIAIDGPSGVGKSTIAKSIAAILGYLYIDTGAIYRAVTWKALEDKIDLENEDLLIEMMRKIKVEFQYPRISSINHLRILLDSEDITEKIREPRIDQHVSDIAKLEKVREELISLQRDLAKEGNIVMEGRDIGSKILLNANLKFFLTASEKERTNRRYQELKNKGFNMSYEEVREQLANRDAIDRGRKCSPLKIARDAIVIDSTGQSIDQVLKSILNIVKNVKDG